VFETSVTPYFVRAQAIIGATNATVRPFAKGVFLPDKALTGPKMTFSHAKS
jgi:hypothetical protein